MNVLKSLEVKIREMLVSVQKEVAERQLHPDKKSEDPKNPMSTSDELDAQIGLLYRFRFLLGQINLAQGQTTRAYFIYKTGIQVIQNHMFNYEQAENGKEPQNEEVSVV